jgi:hypothetical protein
MDGLAVVRVEQGRGGRKEEEASNKLTTGLQHACNKPATSLQLARC